MRGSGIAREMVFREVVLDKLLVATRKEISSQLGASMASTAEFRSFMHHMRDVMVLELRAHVLANHLESQTVTLRVESPRSPWQAKKLAVRQLPVIHTVGQLALAAWTWLFPVKAEVREETHTWRIYDSYPEAEVALPPEYGRPVRIALHEGPAYWEEGGS